MRRLGNCARRNPRPLPADLFVNRCPSMRKRNIAPLARRLPLARDYGTPVRILRRRRPPDWPPWPRVGRGCASGAQGDVPAARADGDSRRPRPVRACVAAVALPGVLRSRSVFVIPAGRPASSCELHRWCRQARPVADACEALHGCPFVADGLTRLTPILLQRALRVELVAMHPAPVRQSSQGE